MIHKQVNMDRWDLSPVRRSYYKMVDYPLSRHLDASHVYGK